jgi:hypothetical protein
MGRIEIVSVTGTTPISVYVSDVYGINVVNVGTITDAIPPTENYYLPSIFNTIPAIFLKLVDATGCELTKFLECREGCAFEIVVNDTTCFINITVLD